MAATVYLVRHATPDWSRTDIRYDIPPGPSLTAQGESEAVQLGAFLCPYQPRRLFVSPLERTQQTAQIAAAQLEVPLLEIAEDVDIAEWQRGEPENEVLARCLRSLDRAAACAYADGAPVVIISHGGPIRIVLQHLGLEQAQIDFYRRQFDRDNPLPPAAAWRLHREHADQNWRFDLAFAPQSFKPYVPEVVYV
jgi:broad specificity phosphatase PhoE